MYVFPAKYTTGLEHEDDDEHEHDFRADDRVKSGSPPPGLINASIARNHPRLPGIIEDAPGIDHRTNIPHRL